MPVPSGAAASALVASQRQWAFSYKAVNQANVEVRDLTVERCEVSNNDLADKSKRTCNVVLAASSTFDTLTEKFRPYVTLANGDTWCMGTFLLASDKTPVLVEAGRSSRALTGYDRLLELEEGKVVDRLVIPTSTVVTTYVISVLVGLGFSINRVSTSGLTLPAPLEFPPGATILSMLNALLSAIGFRSLYMDELGQPVVEPYVDPASAPVLWAYAPGPNAVIRPGADLSLDLFNVPNRWVAYVSEPDRPVLTASYINSNPASPTSTVNRGRQIVDVVQLSQAQGDAPPVNQATLDAKVLQMAQEASQVYSDVEFTTGMMPFHGTGEVFTLDTGSGPIRYREHKWSMDLEVGGLMQHTFRRVVAI